MIFILIFILLLIYTYIKLKSLVNFKKMNVISYENYFNQTEGINFENYSLTFAFGFECENYEKYLKKEEFENLFNTYFDNDFDLYPMEEVIESKLFGDGKENEIFRDALGDYLAIGKSNKTLLYKGSEELYSQHAGYTDDEIYVPLILIKTNKD